MHLKSSHGGIMLGGILSFFGPSMLLSTIFRASSNACAGVGSDGVLPSRSPSSFVDRHDELSLPRQVEAVEVVCFELEDHSRRSPGRT